jgi:hypothetical protein
MTLVSRLHRAHCHTSYSLIAHAAHTMLQLLGIANALLLIVTLHYMP